MPSVRTCKEGIVRTLADVLIPLLRESGLEEGMRFNMIKARWTELFREPLSLHMYPVSLRSGELLVDVDSPVWLQELTLHREKILDTLKVFGLENIRFRLGRVRIFCRGGSRTAPARGKSKLSPQLKGFIDEVLSVIRNDELREVVRRTIEKSLAEKQKS